MFLETINLVPHSIIYFIYLFSSLIKQYHILHIIPFVIFLNCIVDMHVLLCQNYFLFRRKQSFEDLWEDLLMTD